MSKIFGFQKMGVTRSDSSLIFSRTYIRYLNFLSLFIICSKKFEKRHFKRQKRPLLSHFWSIFGYCLRFSGQHGQNIIILFVLCEVHSNTKLLGYGKHMVNV